MPLSSYTRQVKEELARYPVAVQCCARAELRALLEMRGELVIGAQSRHIILQTENAAIARRIFSLFKYCFNLTPQIRSVSKRILHKRNAFAVQVCGNEAVLRVLQTLGFLAIDPPGGKYLLYRQEGGLKKSCCSRAYLRGAFLASGSLNNPRRGYHLEVISPCEDYARTITEIMAAFGLPARFFPRKEKQVVYVKEGEKISEFLRIIAAHSGLLRFENIRVVKGMRNTINRLVNCETANLTRTVLAAHTQLSNIRLIAEMMGMEKISYPLREIAWLRLSYPEATLQELGGLADPPLSKSTVNHRLRRLNALAHKIKREAGM